jgi:His-Xaa-Ser system radical SAM maturase HxsC
MTPLALAGSAIAVSGATPSERRMILRVRDPRSAAEIDDRDGALIRDEGDLLAARARRFKAAVFLEGALLSDNADGFEVTVRLGERFDHLGDGDIVGLDPGSLRLRVLYRRASKHNSFLVTERCNHYCLMCSQPPRNVKDGWIIDEIASCIDLLDPATASVGFTGGEPLLEWRCFIALLAAFRGRLPETAIHVLTNGRAFAAEEVTAAWAALGFQRLTAGIPLYSAVDAVHDYVVQARGAFDDTVLGILRLKDKGQRVEVRIVLHAVTAPRLRETCAWLARNLPFVDHVALMGMENTGFALANQDLLWIDPLDYRADLACGVNVLRAAGMNVSIYNLPLCLLDRSVWDFAVQSISDWKNGYLSECDGCAARRRCAGFFSSGRPRLSRGISPIAAADLQRTLSGHGVVVGDAGS